MKRLLITLSAMATMAIAASCQKELVQVSNSANSPAAQNEISIRAVQGSQTKSAISGTTFPTGYDMLVSAFYIPDDAVKNGTFYPTDYAPSNYFTGLAFTNTSTNIWGVKVGKKYWPIDGTLNFLAVASAGYKTAANGIAPSITWGKNESFNIESTENSPVSNASAKAVLTMPSNAAKFDDVMFAYANSVSNQSAGVSMCFQHAYSSIVFVAKSNVAYDGTNNYGITIDKISVNNTKSTGTLTITNNRKAVAPASPLSAVWSNLGGELATLYAHEWTANTGIVGNEDIMEDLELGTTATVINTAHPFGDGYVLVPEQAVTSFTIEYTIHNGKKGDNSADNRKMKYTYNCTGTGTGTNNGFWQMGKKYIYSINLTLNEIAIAPEVIDWDAQQPVSVPEQEQEEVSSYLTFSSPSSLSDDCGLWITDIREDVNFQYSLDGQTFKDWDLDEEEWISFGGDAKVYLRGNNPEGINKTESDCTRIHVTGQDVHCSGDIMSLINYEAKVNEIPCDYCFQGLFFRSELTEAPTLSATILKAYCYYAMFAENNNLLSAPELPAKELKSNCYMQMFDSSDSLNYVKCLATSGMEGNCYNWLSGVSEQGTFVEANDVTWPSGGSGIPAGWTLQSAN